MIDVWNDYILVCPKCDFVMQGFWNSSLITAQRQCLGCKNQLLEGVRIILQGELNG